MTRKDVLLPGSSRSQKADHRARGIEHLPAGGRRGGARALGDRVRRRRGVHDVFPGEKIRAYVSLRDGQERPADQELIHFARERIAAYKAPEEIVVLAEMLLNAAGKVDRVRLKKLAAGEDVSALGEGGASEAGLAVTR